MTETAEFGRIVLLVSVGFAIAIQWSVASERLRVPAPAVFLAVAAIASDVFPALGRVITTRDVERLCVLALVVILFNGGMEIGQRRFRESFWPIVLLGLPGTFLVAGLLAMFVHGVIGLGWTTSLLVAAAVAPTDPAVMFSVLGGREIQGRTGVILKGESGTNDPVGIALMLGILETATHGGSTTGIAGEFVVEMGVGLAIGLAGGLALRQAMSRWPLPDDALDPLRTLAGAGLIYGFASVAHGSGFLAVFVAGLVISQARVAHAAQIEHFHRALASLGEIVVFVALGLTINLGSLDLRDVWINGLVIAAVLILLIRPLMVASLLVNARLSGREKAFISWAGMRGAVPILLAAFTLIEAADDAHLIYGLVFVVVITSVVIQGSLIQPVSTRLGITIGNSHD